MIISSTYIKNNKFPIHLSEFLNYTTSISETKVNLLKHYYYPFAKEHLNLKNIIDFKIGSNKNKDLLWMQSFNDKDLHLILHLPSNTFRIIIKKFSESIYITIPEVLYLNNYKKYYNFDENKKYSIFSKRKCNIL